MFGDCVLRSVFASFRKWNQISQNKNPFQSKHLKGRSGPRVSHVFDSHIAGWLYGRSGPQVRHVFDSHIAGWL